MTHRRTPPSLTRSKGFAITAGISVLLTGTLLGIYTGIIPAPTFLEAWAAEEVEASRATASTVGQTPSARSSAQAAHTPGNKSAPIKKRGFSKRLFGRLAALLTRRSRSNKKQAAASRRPNVNAVNRVDGGRPGQNNRRSYGSRDMKANNASPDSNELDSREFGVGSVGLGLGGNGGPIAAGALPATKSSDPGLEYDSYFDPNEAIPVVKPAPKTQSTSAGIAGAPGVEGIALEGGETGAANAATSGSSVRSGSARAEAQAFQDAQADYSRQKAADDQWADKKGGGDLKRHKIKLPELGGGKGIRNAPSRTR